MTLVCIIACLSLTISIASLFLAIGSSLYREQVVEQANGIISESDRKQTFFNDDGTVFKYESKEKNET